MLVCYSPSVSDLSSQMIKATKRPYLELKRREYLINIAKINIDFIAFNQGRSGVIIVLAPETDTTELAVDSAVKPRTRDLLGQPLKLPPPLKTC